MIRHTRALRRHRARRRMVTSAALIGSAAALAAAAPAEAASTATISVPGNANLWLADGNSAGGRDPGGAPPSVAVPKGAVSFTVVKVSGSVTCCAGGGPIPPDGGPNATNISAAGRIGPYGGPSNLPLLGLFLTGKLPGRAPADLDQDDTGDFTGVSPAFGQPFYIGDGQRGGGQRQTFRVPRGATKLYLGIPDAYGFTGPPDAYGDNSGAFTAVIRFSVKQAIGGYLKGRVTDSFREGVDNVRITARGKGGTKTSVTEKGGYFEIKLAPMKKPATYTVTAFSRDHDQIDPRRHTVTVKPGGTGYARFTVATGKLKGTVRELLCPAPVTQANCRQRQPRAGAVVEVRGSRISKKFIRTKADGSYEIKVPVGTYTVRVNRLDVDGKATVCKENPAIPAFAGTGRDPAPPVCDQVVDVTAAKGAFKTTDFIAVPPRIVASVDLLAFRRGQRAPRPVNQITAGITDVVKDSLLGETGDRSGRYPTIQCRSGCAVIEVLVRDLFARPVEDFSAEVVPAGISTTDYSVTEGNEAGYTCLLGSGSRGQVPSRCFLRASVTNAKRGRVLGLYAAPGVVSGDVLQLPAATISAPVRIRVERKVPKLDAEGKVLRGPDGKPVSVVVRDVATETIRTAPNRLTRRGSITLSRGDADLLNFYTDATVDRWLADKLFKLAPRACETFERYLADKVFDGVESVTIKGRTVKIALLNQVCEILKSGRDVAQPLLNSFDDRYIALALLQQAKLPLPGLIDIFGWGTNVTPGDLVSKPSPKDIAIRLIPRNSTAATGWLADWVRAWRKALGRPFRPGDPYSLQIHEVTHFAGSTLNLALTPAVHLSLFAPVLPKPTNLVVTQDYDPFVWLNSQ